MQHRFHVLDSYRGIAAVLVVIHHMHYVGSITELTFFKESHLFVEFFFVLSGFVLTHAYAFKSNLVFKYFFIARTFRIMPLHIAMLLVYILLEFGKLFVYNHGMHFNTAPFTQYTSPDTIIPNLLLLQSWLPNTMALSWNSPSWSISIEYYMYMIFFITLLIKKPKQYILWFFISAFSFYFILSEMEFWNNFDKISRGLSSFFAGSLTYLIYRKFSKLIDMNAIYFSLLEIFVLIAVILIISSNIENKSLIISFLFCIKVFVFAFERGIISKLLKKSFFQLLGKLSYSIYMIHAVILFIVFSFILIIQKVLNMDFIVTTNNMLFIDFGNIYYNNLAVLCVMTIIIFFSHFTYKYIEEVGQNFGKKLKKTF